VVNSVVVGMVGTSFLRCTSWDRLEGPARCSVAENPTPAMRAHQGWTIWQFRWRPETSQSAFHREHSSVDAIFS